MRVLTAAVLACVGIAGAAAWQTPQAAPDLVLLGGRIYTVDQSRPFVEAVAIRGDRIAAAGTTDEMRALATASTRTIDLRGAFVTPGFNDGHVHIESTGALLTGANLLDVHTEAPFRERLALAASRLPAGSWITRGDWGAYEQWGVGTTGTAGTAGTTGTAGTGRGPFTPDRRMIDAVTPNHPVLVNRFDQSMYLANSLALKLAGVDEKMPNPEGGEFARDASGRLTGVLRGAAVRSCGAP